jgi:hypothetical protein
MMFDGVRVDSKIVQFYFCLVIDIYEKKIAHGQ